MSYRPPFFFNTQQLSQSQQTSPSQQQSQQPPTLVQTSPSVASYQPLLPAVAPWHQPQQQTVYQSDTGTRYVYDNANQTSVSANPTAISVNPTSHLSMTGSLQTTPNWQGQTVGNVSSSVISTPVKNNGEQVKYSVDKGAPSPVLVSPVKNNREQVKYSVDKGAPSPVPVSPVKNNGEQVKYSVNTEPVSPAEKNGEQGKNNVDKKSASTESSTEMTDSTDSSSTAPTVMTDIQPSKATKEYAAVFDPQPLPQLSPRQEDQL